MLILGCSSPFATNPLPHNYDVCLGRTSRANKRLFNDERAPTLDAHKLRWREAEPAASCHHQNIQQHQQVLAENKNTKHGRARRVFLPTGGRVTVSVVDPDRTASQCDKAHDTPCTPRPRGWPAVCLSYEPDERQEAGLPQTRAREKACKSAP